MTEELEAIEPYLDRSRARIRSFARRCLTRPVIRSLVRTHVEGEENVEGLEGAFIVVPNHTSHLDAPILFTLLPSHMTAHLATGAAADYFYRRKMISFLTSLFFNTYPIERKGKASTTGGRAAGMTRRLLAAGVPILVFPEGTRSRDGNIGPLKAGAAALALAHEIPLVPVAIAGGHEAMPVGARFVKRGSELSLYIGKPMYGKEGEDPDAFIERAFCVIRAMLAEQTAFPSSLEECS